MVSLFKYPKRKLRKMIKNGDYKKALEFGDSLEKKFVQDPDFLFIMGSLHYILENADNAIHYFDRVLQINDFDIESLSLKANVHFTLGEKDQARKCCDRILKIDPDYINAKNLIQNLTKD